MRQCWDRWCWLRRRHGPFLQLLLGNHPLFEVPQYQLVHPVEFALYAVLGALGGLVSAAFTWLLLGLREKFLAAPRWTLWCQPVVGGVLVGLMGWFVPQSLGVGYKHVGDALNGHMVWKLMALLLVLKLVSVAVSYASGNAGGIFGPSLFFRRDAGRSCWYRRPLTVSKSCGNIWSLRAGGNGNGIRGNRARADDQRDDDIRITRDYAVIVPLMIQTW